MGSNEWDMINYFQANDVNYIRYSKSIAPEANGANLVNRNVGLIELWDILPDSIDTDVWLESFAETCGGIEERDAMWREYIGMVDRTECGVLRNIF